MASLHNSDPCLPVSEWGGDFSYFEEATANSISTNPDGGLDHVDQAFLGGGCQTVNPSMITITGGQSHLPINYGNMMYPGTLASFANPPDVHPYPIREDDAWTVDENSIFDMIRSQSPSPSPTRPSSPQHQMRTETDDRAIQVRQSPRSPTHCPNETKTISTSGGDAMDHYRPNLGPTRCQEDTGAVAQPDIPTTWRDGRKTTESTHFTPTICAFAGTGSPRARTPSSGDESDSSLSEVSSGLLEELSRYQGSDSERVRCGAQRSKQRSHTAAGTSEIADTTHGVGKKRPKGRYHISERQKRLLKEGNPLLMKSDLDSCKTRQQHGRIMDLLGKSQRKPLP